MNRESFFLIVLVFVAGIAHSGEIKKWVDPEGNVHFGDAPPAEASAHSVEVTPAYESYPAQESAESDQPEDYYSPQNQLDRINQRKQEAASRQRERREADLEREQKRMAIESDKDKTAATKKTNAAKCEYYTAKIKEYEYKLIQGYKHRAKRLKDESHLALLKERKVRYCNK